MEENGQKLRIALGSASSQKVGYLREVLAEIGIKAEIIPKEVKSGVSEQPLCEAETKKGAINRAKEALRQTPEADFGLGMEVGYHLNKEGKYEMFCCASIVDKNSFARSCFSSRFLRPSCFFSISGLRIFNCKGYRDNYFWPWRQKSSSQIKRVLPS